MRLNTRFLFGILSILLAAIIAFVAIPTITRQTNGKTDIVRIIQPIQRGAQIAYTDIEVVEVGEYNLPSNIARAADDVVGKYAAADFSVGDYVLSSKVSFNPITSDIQLSSIPTGRVAISLTVKTLASGLSDKLQVGDVIRIFHFLDAVANIPELQFVRILSVTDSKGFNVDNAKELTPEEEKQQTATITVLATPEQAMIITALENDGVLHVALICRNNEVLAEELLAEQDVILQEIYAPAEDESEDSTEPSESPDVVMDEQPWQEGG